MATQKQLINLTEQQKGWIKAVVSHSVDLGHMTNQTEIIRVLVDQAMIQDPETFVSQLGKLRLKGRLDALARQKRAIAEEEAQIAGELQTTGGHLVDR